MAELYNINLNNIENESKDEDDNELKDYVLEKNFNDLEQNWWPNVLLDQINDNTGKLNNNKNKNIIPFEIDIEKDIKKRNHWSIENDILKNLYGKEDNPKNNFKKYKKK